MASGHDRGWPMRVLPKLGLAVAGAAALLVATWSVCDQVAGFDAGTSFAVSGGLLAVVAAGLGFWVLCRLQVPGSGRRPGGRDTRSQLVERDGRYAEQRRQSPEKHAVAGQARRQAMGRPSPQRRRPPLVTKRVKFIVDDVEFLVQKNLGSAGTDIWEDYVRIPWSDVTAIGFTTDRYDPVVALYAWTASGRLHVADSTFLRGSECAQLSKLISEATGGRLTLDLAGRDNPRSMPPDW